MTADQLLSAITTLPADERQRLVERALITMTADEQSAVERLIARVQRRIAHPDVPEEVWTGFEQAEDGDLIDMETALNTPYPGDERA